MGRGASVPKFRRAAPGVRREALVEATLECLRKFGHDGVSVRRISAEAGVSPGLINHHFPSITTLLAATYESLALSLLQSIRRHTEDSTLSPRERLTRFFEASFTPNMLDPTLFNTWLVFWSTVSHDEEMRAVHDRTWGAYRALLEALLGELAASPQVPAFDVRLAAIALSALLDGLWVESSLNPHTVEPHEGIALCRDWTEALCSGALPSLRAPVARAGRRARARNAPIAR
jgi:TetR/AcrR family transcriptional regulator, transcriptional repressor of bet genes